MERRQTVSVLLPHPLITQKKGEPLNKGHYGANDFVPCREVVLISEVKLYTKVYGVGVEASVLCREVVPIEGPLSEVPLYTRCSFPLW